MQSAQHPPKAKIFLPRWDRTTLCQSSYSRTWVSWGSNNRCRQINYNKGGLGWAKYRSAAGGH
ncbi:unnamed protein product, partial [Choristocarpus tenellus]